MPLNLTNFSELEIRDCQIDQNTETLQTIVSDYTEKFFFACIMRQNLYFGDSIEVLHCFD